MHMENVLWKIITISKINLCTGIDVLLFMSEYMVHSQHTYTYTHSLVCIHFINIQVFATKKRNEHQFHWYYLLLVYNPKTKITHQITEYM